MKIRRRLAAGHVDILQAKCLTQLAGKRQRVRAIAGVLRLPDNWRLPTWETVRDAYQVHRLRARNPRMALMPGDKESMEAVPDALDYLPVYMGK